MPKISRLLILGLLMLMNAFSFAQLNARYLTQYTESDGVPGSQVNGILADRFGYIWIGTINGLARYDGYEFKRYFNNPNDTTSIRGLIISSLYEDHKGQIWVGSGPENLNVYNPATRSFRQYHYKHLVDHPANVELEVAALNEDGRGRMYLGISAIFGHPVSSALLYIDEKDDKVKQLTTEDKQPIQNVYSITNDNKGNTWLLSYSGFFKIDHNRNLHKIQSADDQLKKYREFPNDIKCDKQGHVWMITSRSKLWDFNPGDDSYTTYSPAGEFSENFSNNSIAFDKYENVWMGTNKGLITFNRKTRQFETFKNESPKQLEKAAISGLQFDSFGSLWISTNMFGILKYEERAIFKSYSSAKQDNLKITPGWANKIYKTHDGKIWVTTAGQGTTGGGINELDLQSNTVRSFPFNRFLPGGFVVNSLYENTPGQLLLNTNLGNYQFSTKNAEVTKLSVSPFPPNTNINQFYTDSKENLWLCTTAGLYKKSKETKLLVKYDLSAISGSDASSNEITGAVESKKHGLWLTTNNGLFLYNYATDKIERHGFDKKKGDIFVTQDINSLYEDTAGIVWVGTWQGGLSRYNAEAKDIKTYTRENGLPSMSVQGILADKQNHTLWLSTFEGLSRFDLKTTQFNNFSVADGIQGQLFADASALKTSEKLFVFGGSNGITVFSPDEITKNSIPAKVFLTDIKLFNKSLVPGNKSILKNPIYDTKEIEFSYNQNNISIEFLAIHYSDPTKNRYAYKMENYDNEWRDVGNQHVAFYPNLPPGKYLFRVKAANNNGVWNETGATLSIIVKAPWWKSLLAYVTYLLISIALVFAVNRYLRKRVLKKERERNGLRELEQAKEIEKAYYSLEQTHETLKATQYQLIQSEKMASLGELTAGIAHEIQNPLNFVNNFSEVSTELLDEMNQRIDNGSLEEAKAIASDVKENLAKIAHHGKRADAIVKGMLQHSRNTGSAKEPTNINALVDEYLRLAYHGLRAKDKSFNATLHTDYDESTGMVNIVPQDIGRVLLNIINNAFYAIAEKYALAIPVNTASADTVAATHVLPDYKPAISVTTKRINNRIEIRIKDNGDGIPQKLSDKIFQPFFTTKPTGRGTGLGLSISYDIVKSHGGELYVEHPAGEAGEDKGAEFVIKLPVG